MCVVNNNQSVIPEGKRGMLFTEPILSNVTALLVANKQKNYLLVNPFAEERINCPEVLGLFDSVILGWE